MDKPKKDISIRDISRLSGVSIATVSRVLNNENGRFSKETERRVMETVEKYHYAPNRTARRLRTREQNFVAIIVPDITNEFFARICQSLQEGLLENGYLALLCNTAESMETQRQYLDMLGIVNLAGIVFVSGSTDVSGVLAMKPIPTIYIDRTPHETTLETALVVESDNAGGAAMAVREMYDKGCRRIAYLRCLSPISTHVSRQAGYEAELLRCGLTPDPALILTVDEASFGAAKRKIAELADAGADFDGLFCATDYLAAGAVAALAERRVDVPGRVKVVGFDDVSIASLNARPITTVHQDIEQISRTAVAELLRVIRGEGSGARRFQIGVTLVRRQTT